MVGEYSLERRRPDSTKKTAATTSIAARFRLGFAPQSLRSRNSALSPRFPSLNTFIIFHLDHPSSSPSRSRLMFSSSSIILRISAFLEDQLKFWILFWVQQSTFRSLSSTFWGLEFTFLDKATFSQGRSIFSEDKSTSSEDR